MLPEEIVWRKKSPYPKTFHPVYTRLCADYVRRIFADSESIASALFDHAAVEALMERPESLAEPVVRPAYAHAADLRLYRAARPVVQAV